MHSSSQPAGYIKIITACLFFVIAGIHSAEAQSFRYGPAIAPAIGFWKVDGDLYVANGARFGFQAGIMAEQTIGSAERFAFTTGLNWNTNPGGFETVATGNQAKAWQFKVHSLDIPLTFRLRSDELGSNVLYAQYGMTLGFTVASKISRDGGKDGGEGFDYEGFNPSLTMAVGMEHILDNDKSLLFGLFFQNGIKNMVIDNANDDNMYPQQIGLRVGMFL
ncbi:MAG: outer membrane beta-barrel protein [Chitinophagales bacterium]